jgi:hypothetical protein
MSNLYERGEVAWTLRNIFTRNKLKSQMVSHATNGILPL